MENITERRVRLSQIRKLQLEIFNRKLALLRFKQDDSELKTAEGTALKSTRIAQGRKSRITMSFAQIKRHELEILFGK